MTNRTMKAWRVTRHAVPSVALSLETIEIPTPDDGEVLISTRATTLNFNDVDGCYGRYLTVNPPLPYTLGMEVVGVVEDAGPDSKHWLGRRVMAATKGAYGGYAQHVIADTGMVFDAPAQLDDQSAAAFYFPFHLAWLGLHERGQLKPGETALIHAGAGGVGSAAIQLAAAAGARVFATAGGTEKTQLCRKLGASLAIDYRTEDFADAVLAATDNRGVDLVFDGVGGATTEASMRCLGHCGRLMVVGFASGIEAEDRPTVTPRILCFGSVSLMGVMLAYAEPGGLNPYPGIRLTPRTVGERIQSSLEALLAQGRIKPIIGEVISFRDIPNALDRMDQRLTTGRIIALM